MLFECRWGNGVFGQSAKARKKSIDSRLTVSTGYKWLKKVQGSRILTKKVVMFQN